MTVSKRLLYASRTERTGFRVSLEYKKLITELQIAQRVNRFKTENGYTPYDVSESDLILEAVILLAQKRKIKMKD